MSKKRRRHWIPIAIVVTLLGIAAYVRFQLHGVWDHPELFWTDPRVEIQVREIVPPEVVQQTRMVLLEGAHEEMRAALKSLGRRAAGPLLKSVLRGFSTDGSMLFSTDGPASQDRSGRALFVSIADCRDPSINPALLRMIADEDEHPDLREGAVVAICWPGNSDAIESLIRLAGDRELGAELRRDILVRLPRLELPPPDSLRELLLDPVAGIDRAAAAALARMGDFRAWSLVAEALHVDPGKHFSDVRQLPTEVISDAVFGQSIAPVDSAENAKLVLPEFYESIASHRDSDFERLRERLRAAERAREHPKSLDEVLAVIHAGRDFDIANAALLATALDRREVFLERIARLEERARRRLGATHDPATVITVLNDLLLGTTIINAASGETGEASRLEHVLETGEGNCVGNSLLYLSITSRLGLPLHSVFSPNHVFLRFDDGLTRRNIETTDAGVEHTDFVYAERYSLRVPIPPSVRDAGYFLVNRKKADLLAALLGNLAIDLLEEGEFEPGIALADRSLAIDPRSPAACFARAFGVFHSTFDDAEALRSVDEGLQTLPSSPELVRLKSVLTTLRGEAAVGLEAVESALDAGLAGHELLHAVALARAERYAAARKVLANSKEVSEIDRRILELAILLREFPDAVDKALKMAQRMPSGPYSMVHTATALVVCAETLLEPGGARPRRAEDARRFLEPAKVLLDAISARYPGPLSAWSSSGSELPDFSKMAERIDWPDPSSRAHRDLRQRYWTLAARERLVAGDLDAVRDALDEALTEGSRTRHILTLERDLERARRVFDR